MQLGVHPADLSVARADSISQLAHALDKCLPLSGVLRSRDFFRTFVEIRLERLDFGNQRPTPDIEREDLVDRRVDIRLGDRLLDKIGIFADQSQVQHLGVSIAYGANESRTHQNAPPWRGVIGTYRASGET